MNLSALPPLFGELPQFGQLPETSGLHPLHLPRSARAAVLAHIASGSDKPLLLLTGRVDAVGVWQAALETWLPPNIQPLIFPEPTALPYDYAPWSLNARTERVATLTALMAGQHPLLPKPSTPPIVITSVRALLHKTVPKRQLMQAIRVIKQNQIIDLAKTLESWSAIGYEQATVVEAPCQFSQRGGILDVYPASAPHPVRIELFGDEVDTIRYFDPGTQRSLPDAVKEVVIAPAREALPIAAVSLGQELEEIAPPKLDDLPTWQDDVPFLAEGKPTEFLEFYLPMIYKNPASLLDYIPADAPVFVDDWVELQGGVRDIVARASQMHMEQRELPDEYPSPLFNWDDFAGKLTARSVIVLGEIQADPPPPTDDDALVLADLIEPGPRFGGQERPFLSHLKRVGELEQRTVVVSRQAQRMAQLWREAQGRPGFGKDTMGQLKPLTSLTTLPPAGSLTFVEGALADGFTLEDEHGTVIYHLLTDSELFGWNRPAPRRRRIQRTIAPETYFSDIKPGDYVVHIEHGVGQFTGMVVRQIGGTNREYLQLNYANNDVLYIPVHHAERLSKWVGSDIHAPTMHRVGSASWTSARKKAQKAVNDLAEELLELYASRETVSGHAYPPDNEWQTELEASFPYSETEDQLKAIAEVKLDMEEARPMDRLICGDVGFGKTEVALRAAFKAATDGRQVAILVPTTVLAQQHFNTFSQRLTAFPVEVGQLSRFRSPLQNTETIKRLADGSIDIVIGTHRLLSADVRFKDLGLLVIDEEQRFGVGHKETLKQMRTEVDVLTMTATPIPRTLYMGLAGLRDISVIETAPQERLPIQTYVGKSDENLLKKAILRELDRGGQIFYVHNHVDTIQAARRKLEVLIPSARIGIGHGQMGEGELEKIMLSFANRELDILVSTTIIESGLDIPNANTLIVDRAELFGLSQMYQLRGRVGRGSQRAYAYFFHAAWRSLTPEAQARLETIDENQELGAGYTIAMRDLEIRGAGELLGGEQSGHIGAVGFDLYMRMLAQAVKSRKGAQEGKIIPSELPSAVTIDLPIPAYIPKDYAPDAGLRLRLYRRMAGLASLPEIDEMQEELADRFGAIPAPLQNLLYQLKMKILASQTDITSIVTEGGQIRMRLREEPSENEAVYVQKFLGDGVRVGKTAIWMVPDLGTNAWQRKLVETLERLAGVEVGSAEIAI